MKPELLLTASVEPRLTQALEAAYEVHKLWLAESPAELLHRVANGVRALVTRSMIGADASLIAALPNLEVIAIFGVGLDAVDLDAARARAIRVTNTRDVLTEDTADYGMALLLALARKIVHGDRYVREGKWPQGPLPNSTRVGQKKLGIVGLGRIGTGIARRAEAFSLEVLYTGPRPKADRPWRYVADLVALAAEVDFLLLSCPGGPETSKMVDADVLRALGPKGMLINIARASVVDEAALITALERGVIQAAALDVVADEPHVSERLLALPNVIVEPHIASTTVETRNAISDLVFANLDAHFAGRALLTPVV